MDKKIWIDIFQKKDIRMANRYMKKMLNITNHKRNTNQNHNERNSLMVQWLGLRTLTAEGLGSIPGEN